MKTDIISYYRDRALEFERVYAKPERQDDLARAATRIRTWFSGKKVLEIACGTGYWTRIIAGVADSVLATDINEAMLALARNKSYPPGRVEFQKADLMDDFDTEKFDNLFAGFIWSHIPRQDLSVFLHAVHGKLRPGATVVFMDNLFAEGSSSPVVDRDEEGNTYQNRVLDNGSRYRILKNFPTEDEIRQELLPVSENPEYIPMTYYWLVRYSIK